MEYLRAENYAFLTTAKWTLAFAHYLLGNRAAAIQAYPETLAYSQAGGDPFSVILATTGLADLQEMENQLFPAAETYRRVLQLCGAQPLPNAGEAHLGLARISYEWNDLDAAERHGQQSLLLARRFDMVIDRYVISEVFLARVSLARGDSAGAAAMLAGADQSVREHNFVQRSPEVAAEWGRVQLRQGNLAEAARLAETLDSPVIRARVRLAQGDPSAALALLSPLRREMVAKDWKDERLKVMVLQAVALQAQGEQDEAVQTLGEALGLAEPGGFIRLFIDEDAPMAELLSEATARGILPDYTAKLLAAFNAEAQARTESPVPAPAQPLIEPLSQREREILRLIELGLSNREIGDRLSLALDTVKGHNRRIFDKLQVERRAEAVARARELGLL
jgi:LuxR family maltose regulon positive regulatory protein